MTNRDHVGNILKFFVYLLPIFLFLIFLSIKMVSPNIYLSLIQEDTVLEYAQAVFYLLSAMLSFLLSVTFLKNKIVLHGILYAVVALGFLFVSIEEISCGQRIFNISTPDYLLRHNFQKEISFHNLNTVQPFLHKIYILIGAYGTFAWLFVLPFVSKIRMRFLNVVNFIVPDWFISSYFFFVFFIYALFDFFSPHPGGFLLWRDQEPSELILSLGFLFFVITNHIKLRECLTTKIHSDM